MYVYMYVCMHVCMYVCMHAGRKLVLCVVRSGASTGYAAHVSGGSTSISSAVAPLTV